LRQPENIFNCHLASFIRFQAASASPPHPPVKGSLKTMPKPQDAYTTLIQALRIFPNVGAKTAQRMAHTLLQQNRDGAAELLAALERALQQVANCRQCNTFCEGDECPICADEKRDPTRLMIVHISCLVNLESRDQATKPFYYVFVPC